MASSAHRVIWGQSVRTFPTIPSSVAYFCANSSPLCLSDCHLGQSDLFHCVVMRIKKEEWSKNLIETLRLYFLFLNLNTFIPPGMATPDRLQNQSNHWLDITLKT